MIRKPMLSCALTGEHQPFGAKQKPRFPVFKGFRLDTI